MACLNHLDAQETTPCSRCGQSFCANCLVEIKSEQLCAGCKDIVVDRLRAGAGGEEGLKKAPMIKRFAAVIVDSLIFSIPVGIFSAFSVNARDPSSITTTFVIINIGALMLEVCYFSLLDGLRGQTLGKMLAKIKTVNNDGNTIGVPRALLRTILFLGPNIISPFVILAMGMDNVAVTPDSTRDYVRTWTIVSTVFTGAYYSYVLISFILARVDTARNRFIHDRLTGSRVVENQVIVIKQENPANG